MKTSMTALEKRRLARLDIDAATFAISDGTSPFNQGQRVFKYQPNDLRFEELKRETPRTAAFKRTLAYLQSQLGGPVPYAFRTTDGAIRSLDAGCLGFLFHRDPPQITFERDDAGYVTSVRLVGPAAADAPAGAPYTVEGLVIAGRKAAFRHLIEAAWASELVTYGEMADHLQIALSNARISHHHMGHVVGSLMDRILVANLEAPLINLELVRSNEREPGLGADSYLRRRFNVRGTLSDERRHDLVEQGLAEVRAFDGWPGLYEQIIGEPLNPGAIADEIDLDGQGDNPRYGGLAESPEHHALKKHVHEHPGCLGLRLNAPVGSIESRLLSGDEMDVELVDGDRRIGVEVKSIRSGELDLRRGIYQCVKYRAVMMAEARGAGRKRRCDVILVTERPLPKDLRALATCLEIPHKVVRINRL